MRNLTLWEASKGEPDLGDTLITINPPGSAKYVQPSRDGTAMIVEAIFVRVTSSGTKSVDPARKTMRFDWIDSYMLNVANP
jgi:hypothetical protein